MPFPKPNRPPMEMFCEWASLYQKSHKAPNSSCQRSASARGLNFRRRCRQFSPMKRGLILWAKWQKPTESIPPTPRQSQRKKAENPLSPLFFSAKDDQAEPRRRFQSRCKCGRIRRPLCEFPRPSPAIIFAGRRGHRRRPEPARANRRCEKSAI